MLRVEESRYQLRKIGVSVYQQVPRVWLLRRGDADKQILTGGYQ